MKNTLMLSLLAIVLLSFTGDSIFKKVDSFKDKNGQKVKVYFYDPLENVIIQNLGYANMTSKEQNQIYSDYLHSSVIYLFSSKVGKDSYTHYIVRGDTSKMKTKYYLEIDIVKGWEGVFDPTKDDYMSKIDTVVNANFGATLFEHMSMFKGKKDIVGNGIQFLGYYRYVMPYSEVKNSMLKVIDEHQ